ncbi:MAG: cytochrome c biogenesis protein ResB [Pyrinomonadaceae bacterium]
MSAAEETFRSGEIPKRKTVPVFNRFLDFISSVRLGVSLLITLVVFSIIGMLIIQQNVNGFDAYFASLTPAERLVYARLGLFDIYHSWYFNLLLLVLSLNIVLASIDRFPSAWSYIAKPKTWATKKWLLTQPVAVEIALSDKSVEAAVSAIKSKFEANGLKTTVSEKHGLNYVFGERGRFNRIGAYIVHVALLTLFLGHFVALQTGFDADVRMIPGQETNEIQMIEFDLDKKEKFNVQLPFTLTCTDIQQKLIDPRGTIEVTNTLDWRTQMMVDDPQYGSTIADISMNKPFNYRGYRFFQAQTIPVGNAREITLDITSQGNGEQISLTIPRLGSSTLADGTSVEYAEFLPDFVFNNEGKPDTRSGEYNNPVAVLNVTPPDGERIRVFAFAGNVAENIPVGAPKAGYKWRLSSYEKAPFAHVLSIKYDPFNGAFIAWYFGGFGLIGALCFVFFFSHKRVWALIENSDHDTVGVTLGGNTNRNHAGLEEKFQRIASEIRGDAGEGSDNKDLN